MNIRWQRKTVCLIMGAIALSCTAHAQLSLKRQKYDSIAARYSDEHAVYTEIYGRTYIGEEDGGGLYAKTTRTEEELFISERSLNRFKEYVPGMSIYIPEGNDYRLYNNRFHPLTRNAITRVTYSGEGELDPLPPFYFSQEFPVLNATLEVVAPKYVKMGFLLKGADTTIISRSVTEKNGKIIYRFTAKNVPAQKEYEGVPSDEYYRPHVIPYVISFRLAGSKKDSLVAGSLEALTRNNYAYVRNRNLENDSYIDKKVAELTRSAYSDREKVQRIYDWVQNNFHYRQDYDFPDAGVIPHQADTVCKRMFGDCKDMSSVFNAMLAKAGIRSYYVVIGTNQKPYTHEEMQTGRLYDHMVAAVKLDGEWVFLDGTTHVMPLGANRADLQGKEANILLGDRDSKIVTIPTVPASQNVTTDHTTINLAGDKMTGTIYAQYNGYAAWNIGENMALINREYEKDKYIKHLLDRGNSNFVIQSYNINTSHSGRKDASVDARFTLGGYVQQVKREHYVNLNLLRTMEDSRVNDENRNVAYYFPYKETIKETVTLNVPKGYSVSHIPKSAKGGKADLWTYSISYKYDARTRTITLTKEYVLNTMKIEPKQFEEHNRLVDELKKQYKETVVLTGK